MFETLEQRRLFSLVQIAPETEVPETNPVSGSSDIATAGDGSYIIANHSSYRFSGGTIVVNRYTAAGEHLGETVTLRGHDAAVAMDVDGDAVVVFDGAISREHRGIY